MVFPQAAVLTSHSCPSFSFTHSTDRFLTRVLMTRTIYCLSTPAGSRAARAQSPRQLVSYASLTAQNSARHLGDNQYWTDELTKPMPSVSDEEGLQPDSCR